MRLTRGETADETLVANQRLRADAADLRAQTIALMLRYRRHRFQPICGSSGASEDDSVRRQLRDFLSGAELRTLYGGYSRRSVCRACGNIIKPGELEYDVAGAHPCLRRAMSAEGAADDERR